MYQYCKAHHLFLLLDLLPQLTITDQLWFKQAQMVILLMLVTLFSLLLGSFLTFGQAKVLEIALHLNGLLKF